VVLLWSMAANKKINLMSPDFQGNNPMHYACLADSSEVIGFLMQQTKGFFTEQVRLVESRNRLGETPLLRAMVTGVNAVIKTLMDEGADMLTFDNQGNNLFTALAKNGHLWTLNFVYQLVCNRHGAQVALELMSQPDHEGHTPLEWAADSGDVNIMEFFMRKGLSPYRRDPMNRTALFWAVKSGRVAAARFLVKCGCDVDLIDTTGQSPLKIARESRHTDMLRALDATSLSKDQLTLRASYQDLQAAIHDTTVAETQDVNMHLSSNISASQRSGLSMHSHSNHSNSHNNGLISPPLCVISNNKRLSHAIEQRNRSSNANIAVFGTIVLFLWILTLLVPFYAWLFIVFSAALYHRHLDQQRIREANDPSRSLSDTVRTSTLQAFLRAPEKGLGLWVGCMIMYLLYLLSATVVEFYRGGNKHIDNQYTEGRHGYHTFNPLDLGALSFVQEDFELYCVVCGLFVLCVTMWVKLVYFDYDPGIVDTRDVNFEEIMAQSFAVGGCPSTSLFCPTTLVRKPVRSKYCTRTGCVVARFDHQCLWLNTTIGHNNHRTFIVFLVAHLLLCTATLIMLIKSLHREVPLTNSCAVISHLFSAKFFFVFAFVAFVALIGTGLLILTCDQCYNIAANLTLNERKNWTHYYWILDSDGTLCNKFDRGWFINTLEFWRFPGLKIDYEAVFELPTLPERSRYALTQENIHANIMRYSNSSGQAQLLPTHDPSSSNEKGLAASINMSDTLQKQRSDRTSSVMMSNTTSSRGAAPSTIDIELVGRNESRDSYDTTNLGTSNV